MRIAQGAFMFPAFRNVAPVNTVAPVISGDAAEGSTLTADSLGTWTGTPTITYARQWQKNTVDIGGQTGATYATAGDAGSNIRLKVTATGPGGVTIAYSNTIAVVAADPPVNTEAPSITGSAPVGSTLTCDPGEWTNSPSSYLYQWYHTEGGADISGATSSTYVSQNSDAGWETGCRVRAVNAGGTSDPATATGGVVPTVTWGAGALLAPTNVTRVDEFSATVTLDGRTATLSSPAGELSGDTGWSKTKAFDEDETGGDYKYIVLAGSTVPNDIILDLGAVILVKKVRAYKGTTSNGPYSSGSVYWSLDGNSWAGGTAYSGSTPGESGPTYFDDITVEHAARYIKYSINADGWGSYNQLHEVSIYKNN